MILDDVHRGIHKHKKKRRLGRGIGSGHGKTAGRGHKGQGSRAGYDMPAAFQGGMSPLVRRIPKRGFNNPFAKKVVAVNVSDLEAAFSTGDAVTPDALSAKGLVKGEYDVLKVLGDGELSKKLTVSAHRFSKSAVEKIERAGGATVVLPGPAPVVKGQKRSRQ